MDENWFHGELNGSHGFLPASYIQCIRPLSQTPPQGKALYDFQVKDKDQDKDCLTFTKVQTSVRSDRRLFCSPRVHSFAIQCNTKNDTQLYFQHQYSEICSSFALAINSCSLMFAYRSTSGSAPEPCTGLKYRPKPGPCPTAYQNYQPESYPSPFLFFLLLPKQLIL